MLDNPSKIITILIADDEPMARAGIRAILSQAEDFEIIGEVQDGFEVLELVPKLHPKILLLDYQMPGPRAAKLEEWVRENHPETLVLVLTAHDRDAYLAKVIDSGIVGYLLKNENAKQLIGAIRRAAEGTVYFSEDQIARVEKWRQDVEEKWESLSLREQEVSRQVALGKDNKAIASSLHITPKTVEYHVSSILKKLDMNSRDEVIVWMLKHHPNDPDK